MCLFKRTLFVLCILVVYAGRAAYAGSGLQTGNAIVTQHGRTGPNLSFADNYWAVIVGVADYPGSRYDLAFSDNDALDIYNTLVETADWHPQNITLLINENATAGNIQHAVRAMAERAGENDCCLFYFSGHGSAIADAAPIDENDGLDETLVCFDRHLSDDEVGTWFTGFPPNLCVIIDACHSGGQIKSPGIHVKSINFDAGIPEKGDGFASDLSGNLRLRDLDDNQNGVILTAADDGEYSVESSLLQHGVFSYFVLQAFWDTGSDGNGDGRIAAEEIFDYAAPRTTDYYSEQHPRLYDEMPGELDIAVYERLVKTHDLVLENIACAAPLQADRDVLVPLCVENAGEYAELLFGFFYTWGDTRNNLKQGGLGPTGGQVILCPGQHIMFQGQIKTPPVAGRQDLTIVLPAMPGETNIENNSLTVSVYIEDYQVDEEFNENSLRGYALYVPQTGPVFDMDQMSGFLRLLVPDWSAYDHWRKVDHAPQLRRDVESENWLAETCVQIVESDGSRYHTGLGVYFDRYDLFYWGFNSSTGVLKLSRTGKGGLIVRDYDGGDTVELAIKKTVERYDFLYRRPGTDRWICAGSCAKTTPPQYVLLLGKTWTRQNLMARFDYFRLTNTDASPDEEFNSLAGYSTCVPLAGPELSVSERPGWLRVDCPADRPYDHWRNKDEAPQVRRPLDTENWQMETSLFLQHISGECFHCGLCVYFSRYDLFYWGFNRGTHQLMLSRTGKGRLIVENTTAGPGVELRVRKLQETYYFDYRPTGESVWINAGSCTTAETPVEGGVIVKTFGKVRAVCDFDYLRVTGSGKKTAQCCVQAHNNRPEPGILPEELSVSHFYPNPFNGMTKISVFLPGPRRVSAVVYNIKGEVVRTLYNGPCAAGRFKVCWDAGGEGGLPVNSGVYFVRIRIQGRHFIRKVLLVR